MKISIIVAAAKNNVIGLNNRIPWYIPEDLRHFKDVTRFKCVIMGRKTFESIGKPLPTRTNIVITSNIEWSNTPNLFFVSSLEEALKVAEKYNRRKFDEIFIIGGVKLYEEALPITNTIYLTRINRDVEGDTCIPDSLLNGFKLSKCSQPYKDFSLECTYEFQTHTRI